MESIVFSIISTMRINYIIHYIIYFDNKLCDYIKQTLIIYQVSKYFSIFFNVFGLFNVVSLIFSPYESKIYIYLNLY